MKKLLILLTFSIVYFHVKSQTLDGTQNVIPPSPRSESFQIYGDIPISYNTGIPDISIPLYTIRSGDYVLPISLRYHLASVKPPYDQSNIAFGWTLECNGLSN